MSFGTVTTSKAEAFGAAAVPIVQVEPATAAVEFSTPAARVDREREVKESGTDATFPIRRSRGTRDDGIRSVRVAEEVRLEAPWGMPVATWRLVVLRVAKPTNV